MNTRLIIFGILVFFHLALLYWYTFGSTIWLHRTTIYNSTKHKSSVISDIEPTSTVPIENKVSKVESFDKSTQKSAKDVNISNHLNISFKRYESKILYITSIGKDQYSMDRCTNLNLSEVCQFIPWTYGDIPSWIDAVIFRPHPMVGGNYTRKWSHPRHQKWVFFEVESPYVAWKPHNYYLDIWKDINITASFTEDADIPYYVFGMTCRENKLWIPPGENYAKNKTGGILWVATRCTSPSGREHYVAELQRHIQVDIFGKCGKQIICKHEYLNSSNSKSCLHNQIASYKFYLAFENSLCEGYYTEKIGRMIRSQLGTIPVVMGLVNYSTLIAPGTYIDVLDFTSPKALAQYLQYLSNNDTAYNEYIERQKKVKCESKYAHFPIICRVCRYLHAHKGETQIAKDARSFWDPVKRCQSPHEFFTGIADSIIGNITEIPFKGTLY